jgi:molybdopterin molybdotransferase
MMPGKPVWFASRDQTLALRLPGNPVTARLLLAPLLAGLAGRQPSTLLCWDRKRLLAPLARGGDRDAFVRASWGQDGVTPVCTQDSGMQFATLRAEVLIRRPAYCPAAAIGDEVEVLDF